MRLLFLLLLLANVAYVGWELYYPHPHQHRVVTQDPGVKRLVLLSELPHTEKALPRKKVQAPTQVATLDSSKTEKTPEKPQESKPAKTPEKAPVEKAKVPPAPEKPAKPEFACYTLGPFRDLANLHKLTRRIHKYVAEASYRSHEEREESMYWVYLPRQKSYEAALVLGKQLKRKHIRDYYVIPKGDNANMVSLGYFKEKRGALSVQKKAKAVGFPARIQVIFKTYTIYWLDYRVRTDLDIPSSVLDVSKMPNVSRLDRRCN